MASRITYTLVAATGIAVASLAAWWLQKPSAGSAQTASAATAPSGADVTSWKY